MIDNIIYRLFGIIDNFVGYQFDKFKSDDPSLKKRKKKK